MGIAFAKSQIRNGLKYFRNLDNSLASLKDTKDNTNSDEDNVRVIIFRGETLGILGHALAMQIRPPDFLASAKQLFYSKVIGVYRTFCYINSDFNETIRTICYFHTT